MIFFSFVLFVFSHSKLNMGYLFSRLFPLFYPHPCKETQSSSHIGLELGCSGEKESPFFLKGRVEGALLLHRILGPGLTRLGQGVTLPLARSGP